MSERGERGYPGERGQKGDHGQHGDEGPEGQRGDIGERGAHGLEGDAGERGQTGDTGQSGETGHAGQRGERGPSNWWSYAIMGIGVAIALWVLGTQVSENRHQTNRIAGLVKRAAEESRDRRDQACRGLELGHKQEIADLERLYKFYADPPPAFKDLLQNPLVAKQLRDAERDARNDQDRYGVFVPPYCDQPNMGLPEPDPRMAKRPPGLVVGRGK